MIYLELSDDAARINWGGKWRMPTKEELDELRKECTWTWTLQNDVYGYKVTSKNNGNSIFLPATGVQIAYKQYDLGEKAFFWCSSLDILNPFHAIHSEDGSYYGSIDRSIGIPIRAVTDY